MGELAIYKRLHITTSNREGKESPPLKNMFENAKSKLEEDLFPLLSIVFKLEFIIYCRKRSNINITTDFDDTKVMLELCYF